MQASQEEEIIHYEQPSIKSPQNWHIATPGASVTTILLIAQVTQLVEELQSVQFTIKDEQGSQVLLIGR